MRDRLQCGILLSGRQPEIRQQLLDPPGGMAHDPQPFRDLAKAIHAQGGTIATICVGVLPVAEAGLLPGEKATSYVFSRRHDNLGRLRELDSIPTPGPIEISNRIISCSGPAQSFKVAMLLLERIVGPEAASEVGIFMAGTDQTR